MFVINTDKLTEGLVVKNYKELCSLVGEEIKDGNSKKAQMKDFERYFKYHKQGHKFVIDEVYDTPLPKEDNIGNTKNYPQFKVDKDKWYNKGVYMIKLDNQVYIGSTVREFRQRFKEHSRGDVDYMKHTQELLKQGGEFSILHDMSDIEDIELIRMVEEEYILFYTYETDYDVINRRMSTFAYKEPKIKYKTIKIEEEYYEQIVKYYNELSGECDE